MSRAEDNYREHLSRQCASDRASTTSGPIIRAELARLNRLERAVVEAAMAWHAATMRPRVVTEEHLDAACAALAKAEGEAK